MNTKRRIELLEDRFSVVSPPAPFFIVRVDERKTETPEPPRPVMWIKPAGKVGTGITMAAMQDESESDFYKRVEGE